MSGPDTTRSSGSQMPPPLRWMQFVFVGIIASAWMRGLRRNRR